MLVKSVEQFAAVWYNGAVPQDRAERQIFAERVLEAYFSETQRRLTGPFSVEEFFLHRDRCAKLIEDAMEALARQDR
jgi:hypothetical protein